MDPEKIQVIQTIAPMIAIVGVSAMAGWVITTWMRIKAGYPLDGAWGQAVYPKAASEDPKVKQIVHDNAALRAELGAVKDRLATLEAIVTDGGYSLTHQIEALRDKPRLAAGKLETAE
ncbi:MAG: hypothetical protein ACREBO_13785 [Novosphingobium sp.]